MPNSSPTIPSTDRLTLTVTDFDLPDDQVGLTATLEEVIRSVLSEEYGHEGTVTVDVCIGHWYASISSDCPNCGKPLALRSIHTGDANDAYAWAVCTTRQCGWSGDAVYRIVDLDRATGADYESSVLSGHVTPTYHSYRTRRP